MAGFQLHPRLAEDCIVLGRFELSLVLLMNDSRYPWCILVPQRDGIREIHELSETDQQQLLRESSLLSRLMSEHFQAEKMNLGALGNIVPQLHLHHIARHSDDAAWPGPVWGHSPATPYSDRQMKQRLSEFHTLLQAHLTLN